MIFTTQPQSPHISTAASARRDNIYLILTKNISLLPVIEIPEKGSEPKITINGGHHANWPQKETYRKLCPAAVGVGERH